MPTVTRTASPISASTSGRKIRAATPVSASLWDSHRSRPLLLVEIAFASNPGDTVPIWTDVTRYVRSFSIKRGRQFELDQFQPGNCEVLLTNQAREFDPSYVASPYYPNVRIGKRMRVSAIWSSLTYRLFDGYVDAWPQTWQNITAATVPVRATDAFKRFEMFPLNGDYPNVVLGQAPWGYWKFANNLTDSSSQGNNGTWSGTGGSDWGGFEPLQQTLIYSKKFAASNLMTHAATGYSSGPFSIECWIWPDNWAGNDGANHTFWISDSNALNTAHQRYLVKNLSNDLMLGLISPSGSIQQITYAVNASTWPMNSWRYVVCTASATAGMSMYVDGVLVAGPTYVGTLSLPTSAPAAPRWGYSPEVGYAVAYMAHCALHNTYLTADQVYDRWKSTRCYFAAEDSDVRLGHALDVLGWPAADRDFDGGAAALAIGHPNETLLSYARKINASEVGRLFMGGDGKVRFIGRDATASSPYTDVQAIFGDSSGELPYSDIVLSYDDVRVWNEIRLQRADGSLDSSGVLQIARDTDLQTTDIVRTYSDTSLLHSTDSQVLAAAQYRLSQYAEAVPRIDNLTIKPLRDPASLWPHALGREIGDRVTVVRRPQRQGTISQQVYIEGIEHSANAAGEWETRYTLSLADVTTFWILGLAGRSELDDTTVLSF